MAYDGWVEFNGQELVNLSRTAQLAESMGIDTVWVTPESVAWIETALGGSNYDSVLEAPWYDAGFPASGEFAGFIPLGMSGLDDSTLTSTPIEYTSDGGHSGKPRHTTLPIVANFAIIASTDRGAQYGKRWLDSLLKNNGQQTFCSGADIRYFLWDGADAPKAHRRDTRQTRGTSVTRKRTTDCSATWLVTFTLTAADPFEYSEPIPAITELGGVAASGPKVTASGTLTILEQTCPVYDYTPIYDPLYPAMVAAPSAPDFYPSGWDIAPGMTFDRFWATVSGVEPSTVDVVPIITFTSTSEARMVRVSIWPNGSDVDEQCDPLFTAIITYLPPGVEFTIDGEQQASYVWDGSSPGVRRADSLVYGTDATPIQWVSLNDPLSLRVTLDLFSESGVVEGDGNVRLALDFVQKSD